MSIWKRSLAPFDLEKVFGPVVNLEKVFGPFRFTYKESPNRMAPIGIAERATRVQAKAKTRTAPKAKVQAKAQARTAQN